MLLWIWRRGVADWNKMLLLRFVEIVGGDVKEKWCGREVMRLQIEGLTRVFFLYLNVCPRLQTHMLGYQFRAFVQCCWSLCKIKTPGKWHGLLPSSNRAWICDSPSRLYESRHLRWHGTLSALWQLALISRRNSNVHWTCAVNNFPIHSELGRTLDLTSAVPFRSKVFGIGIRILRNSWWERPYVFREVHGAGDDKVLRSIASLMAWKMWRRLKWDAHNQK